MVLHLDERLGFVAAHGGLHCEATGIGEAGSLGMRRHETAAGKRAGARKRHEFSRARIFSGLRSQCPKGIARERWHVGLEGSSSAAVAPQEFSYSVVPLLVVMCLLILLLLRSQGGRGRPGKSGPLARKIKGHCAVPPMQAYGALTEPPKSRGPSKF